MSDKTCTTCGILQPYTNFFKNKETKDGYRPDCKNCRKIYQSKNKDKIKKQKRKHYLANANKLRNKSKKYREENKEKVSEVKKKWYKKDPYRYSEVSRIRRGIKYKTDISYRINNCMSGSISKHLKGNKLNKRNISWKDLVGYKIEELRSHIESLFIDGMSWDNHGKHGWHIDHIIPKSFFKFDSYDHPAFKACWALENLQPLWCYNNWKKNNKVILTVEQKTLLDRVNIKF